MIAGTVSDGVTEPALRAALIDAGTPDGASAVITARYGNPFASRARAEILSCRLGDDEINVLCKTEGWPNHSASHRRGVAAEVRAYRDLLSELDLGTARYLGGSSDGAFLLVEWMEGAVVLKHADDPSARLVQAAVWAGRLRLQTLDASKRWPWLPQLDARGVVDTVAHARALLGSRHPGWTTGLAESAERLASLLCSVEGAVIHGEYYPLNILVAGDRVVPIDWESTMVGPAEVDLAALTDGWCSTDAERCISAYSSTTGDRVEDVALRMSAARIYLSCRLVVECAPWVDHPRVQSRIDELRMQCERLGEL